jgi:anti-sigma factor RsiW
MFDFLRRWTQTEHEACQDNLSPFLDGQLSARQRSRVERHLQECAACREELESVRQTVSLLRSAAVLRPPRSFLIGAGEIAKQRQVRRRRLSYVYLQAATAVASVLLVLVVSGDAILRLQPLQPGAEMSRAGAVTETREFAAGTAAAETLQAGQADELTTEAAQPATPSTEPVAAAPLNQTEAVPSETAQAMLQHEVSKVEALPSMTFARPAEPPAPPPLAAEAEPTSPEPTMEGLAADAATEIPQPTLTPAPPTATPVPPTQVPTHTPVPPTAAPAPAPTAGEAEEPLQPVSPMGPPSLLERLRPSLSWIEGILATIVVLLLIVLLWLRARL